MSNAMLNDGRESDDEIVLSCRDLGKTYQEGAREVPVLNAINLDIRKGERVAVIGSSGSGKTTLLNLLGGLDLPTAGSIKLAGSEFSSLTENERGLLRNRHLGFVYQFHHLLNEFTALENVAMPLLIGGSDKETAERKSEDMLDRVGLGHRLQHKPSELSGGERQRVAIARALVSNPTCVLLDEPTGNLDGKTALDIQELISQLNAQLGISFVIVTHDEQLARSMDRLLVLKDGGLHESRD